MSGLLRVGILGATGRVGTLLLEEIATSTELTLAAAITRSTSNHLGTDVGEYLGRPKLGCTIQALTPQSFVGCDVVIDFSLPEGLQAALPHLGHCPLVSGTTGLDETTETALARYATGAPVFTAANFSTGVHVLMTLVAQAAKALDDYEIEIIETHHRYKKDAPSGTALALGRAAADARGHALDAVVCTGRSGITDTRAPETIGIHAIRMGQVVGEHTVSIASDNEILTLGHAAQKRGAFAVGALRAARWLVAQPAGRYTMSDMLGLY